MKAIYDDMEEYKRLCRLFNEGPVYKDYSFNVDCYVPHANELRKRDLIRSKKYGGSRKYY